MEERGQVPVRQCRIPANDSLQRDIEELLTRPVGRPSKKPLVVASSGEVYTKRPDC